jgi:hypothetical protein
MRVFKNMDAFGHPIALNFENKGTTHRTCCGFLTTVLWLLISIGVLAACFTPITLNDSTWAKVVSSESEIDDSTVQASNLMMLYLWDP